MYNDGNRNENAALELTTRTELINPTSSTSTTGDFAGWKKPEQLLMLNGLAILV